MRKFDVAYFTASCDKAEDNKRFAESLTLDYPILSDPSTETAKQFGVVSGENKLATRWTYYIGKDGKVLHIDKTVKAASHASDVAAKLKELGVATKN